MKRLAGRLWGAIVAGVGQLNLVRRERTLQAQKLQALQLLEAIANSSTDAIFAKDAKGRYILFNRAAAALVGKPAEAVLGQDDTALFPPQQVEAIMAEDRQVLTSGPMVNLEQELNLSDGVHTFLTTKGPLCNADGTALGLFGIARDITERKRAEREIQALNAGLEQRVAERTAALEAEIAERKRVEEQLRESEQRFRELNADLEHQVEVRTAEARAASAAKSEFLANMSHEIRTPMNAVLGLAQLLAKEPLAPDQRDMVQRILAAGCSLLGIINDILDFSRIETGQLTIASWPFNLMTLLDHVTGMVTGMAREKGLELRLETPAGVAGSLDGDSLRLEQILLNLLGNAIKFTEQGDIRIRVQPVAMTDATTRLRFEVRDTGVGITPEVLSTLFQPFTQADGSITRRFGGTGLGLSISRRLVELMGGTIGADSTAGVGSVFWFELPFARTTAAAPAPEPGAPEMTPAGPRLAGRRILVVDDSDMNRALVARVLQREGAEATLAHDGQQALDVLRAAPQGFDAVLMDIQMPVLDGLSATRAIRNELGLTELPVIALTASVRDEDQQQAFAAGVNDFLGKPVSLEELTERLQRWTSPAPVVENVPVPVLAAPAADQKPSSGMPEIPGFDAQQVAHAFGNDRAFFLELLAMFCANFGDTAQQVRADLARGDRAAAARRLHTLRGTGGTLGTLELMRSAQALERAIVDGRPEVERLLEPFATQLADLIQAVAPWIR